MVVGAYVALGYWRRPALTNPNPNPNLTLILTLTLTIALTLTPARTLTLTRRRPALTAARFGRTEEGERCFRTGDLGARGSRGELLFLGDPNPRCKP